MPGQETLGGVRLFSLKQGEHDPTPEGSCKGAGENLVSWPMRVMAGNKRPKPQRGALG